MPSIQTIIMTVAIPFVVMFLRKMNLPSKWCPIAAFGVAIALVALAKVFGVDMDINTIAQAIIQSLGMAGVAVLGYDTVKKAIETK